MAKSSKKVVQETKVIDTINDTDVQEVQEMQGGQDDKFEPRKTEFEQLITRIEQSQSELKTLKADLHKFYGLVSKDFKKANKGRRRANRERSPTGFGKASVVPSELRTLLGISETENMTRPDVTKKLYAYLDEHKLRDADDNRIMRVDAAIAKAFGLTAEQVKTINSYKKPEEGKIEKDKGLNFFNIQRYVAALYKGSVATKVETEVETETETKQPKGRGKKATA